VRSRKSNEGGPPRPAKDIQKGGHNGCWGCLRRFSGGVFKGIRIRGGRGIITDMVESEGPPVKRGGLAKLNLQIWTKYIRSYYSDNTIGKTVTMKRGLSERSADGDIATGQISTGSVNPKEGGVTVCDISRPRTRIGPNFYDMWGTK